MVKMISRIAVAPLIVLVLACSGLMAASFAPKQALAETTGQLTASVTVQTVDVQASSASKAKKAFAGKYNLIKMNNKGKIYNKKTIDSLRRAGYKVTLSLKKNGKAAMSVFGKTTKGTWKASTTKRGKVTWSTGATVIMKKSGKTLTMSNNGVKLTFKKK